MCNNVSGNVCVPAACSNLGQKCALNHIDICCELGGTPDAGQCVLGNCCSVADCKLDAGSNIQCAAHFCQPCDAAFLNWTVDPLNGDDNLGTGTSVCPLRSITKALALIGDPGSATRLITVLGMTTISTATGEVFPITVPGRIQLIGSAQYPPTVQANGSAFVLDTTGSLGNLPKLSKFTIIGTGQTGTGIDIIGTSASGATVDHVTVKEFQRGIHVYGVAGPSATLTLGGGVSLTHNKAGLVVEGSATVSTTGDPILINLNTQSGIVVQGFGKITLTGTPDGTVSGGTTVVRDNDSMGVPALPAYNNPSLSTFDGLVSYHNGLDGLETQGLAHVKLRNSVLLYNGRAGVSVFKNTDTLTNPNDVSFVDLGSSGDAGKNLLQSSGAPNATGICLDLDPGTQTLSARGNIFKGPRDCSQSSPGNVDKQNDCTGGADVSSKGTNNAIDVTNCGP
jgi:hypothetical protein